MESGLMEFDLMLSFRQKKQPVKQQTTQTKREKRNKNLNTVNLFQAQRKVKDGKT